MLKQVQHDKTKGVIPNLFRNLKTLKSRVTIILCHSPIKSGDGVWIVRSSRTMTALELIIIYFRFPYVPAYRRHDCSVLNFWRGGLKGRPSIHHLMVYYLIKRLNDRNHRSFDGLPFLFSCIILHIDKVFLAFIQVREVQLVVISGPS